MNLEKLNKEQYEAVMYLKGPLLVTAGAGSGKTRVITYKIAKLIYDEKIPPYQIMALTFTNKAAKEMSDRIEKLTNISVKGLWIGTFHSICARILRYEKYNGGNFTIYDTDDQKKVIKNILKHMSSLDNNNTPSVYQSRISSLKNKMITPDSFSQLSSSSYDELFVKIYNRYEKELLKNNALDFDDLIMKTIFLFNKNQDIKNKYEDRFKYILVDEYQDTNYAQYEFVKQLSQKNNNITVVGDEDQSIYAWRGGDIRNILNFENTYSNVKTIRLEQNYRSTKTILQAANSVIKNNSERKEKNLWTSKDNGQKLEIVCVTNEREEAKDIAEYAANKSFDEVAVLYRTNSQSRTIEDELRNRGIPYIIVGGVKFYERMEIKDILAYLRLVDNPKDDISFRRILNVPKRKIGKKTEQSLEKISLSKNIPLTKALDYIEESLVLTKTEKQKLIYFRSLYNELKKESKIMKLNTFVEFVISSTGYLRSLEESNEEKSRERIDNLSEFINAVSEYCDRSENPGLGDFLEEVSLITDIDSLKEYDAKKHVTLMTLHSSKGLEFKNVILPGLEDGLFPIRRGEAEENIEEERRLFYVGLTRAKENVRMYYTTYRKRFGATMVAHPSVFIDEIPNELAVKRDNSLHSFRQKVRQKQQKSLEKRHKSFQTSFMPDYENYSQVHEDCDKLYIGQDVWHSIWGKGKVLKISGFNENMKAEIEFENTNQTKKIMVKYANLKTA